MVLNTLVYTFFSELSVLDVLMSVRDTQFLRHQPGRYQGRVSIFLEEQVQPSLSLLIYILSGWLLYFQRVYVMTNITPKLMVSVRDAPFFGT